VTVRSKGKERLVEEAMIRANLYRIIGAFFLTPPTEQFLTALASSPVAPFQIDSRWTLDELVQEFHDLFMVPTGPYVFPFESCYEGRRGCGSAPGLLMGKPAREVQDSYRRAGFELAAENSELPDHAGVEFSFLQALAERETAAWRDGDEQQARDWRQLQLEFLSTHTSRWIPALCDEIAANTTQPYFRVFAEWIRSVVEEVKPAEDDCGLACPGKSQDRLL
jgi:TorA maturation chaperone TorD